MQRAIDWAAYLVFTALLYWGVVTGGLNVVLATVFAGVIYLFVRDTRRMK